MERNANAYYELLAATVEAFNERIQSDELTECSDYSDALHEVVDGQVPHYYHEIFTVMSADGIDLEFDDSGLIPDTKDVTRILQARIYEQLYNDVSNSSELVWFEDPEEDDEESFWVVNERGVFVEQAVPFEVAKACCDDHYAIGQHFKVENYNDVVVYDPANQNEVYMEEIAIV